MGTLKNLRIERNLTIQDISSFMGISNVEYENIEKEKCLDKLDLGALLKLAIILDVDINKLLDINDTEISIIENKQDEIKKHFDKKGINNSAWQTLSAKEQNSIANNINLLLNNLPSCFSKPTKLNSIPNDVDYIMCVDENGNEGLIKNARKAIREGKDISIHDQFLTITGCIFKRNEYHDAYKQIHKLKEKYWPQGCYFENGKSIAVCLHSRDIRRQNTPFDNMTINHKDFIYDLSKTIENLSFKIISATIDVKKYALNAKYNDNIYFTAMKFLLERYIYATRNHKKGIIVIESRKSRNDSKLLKQIVNLFLTGSEYLKEVEFRDRIKGIYFNDKRNYQQTHSYIGLEIVDLCSYPINKYIKLSKKDEAFLIIENKLDKGIEKAIKRFP